MNTQIALLLGQDGVTSGAIYALLALAIVLVFTVTRVMLVPQGEFVTFGAMTMAALQAGQPASLTWLLLGLALLRSLQQGWALRTAGGRALRQAWPILVMPLYALLLLAIGRSDMATHWPMAAQVLYTLALVVPLGPLLYDLCFRPVASAHALVLLIVSIAVHVVLVGLALLMFGAEGARTQPFSEDGLPLGPVQIGAQTLWVVAAALLMILALYVFFERTLQGKALRATAVSRLGAQLMGISPAAAGRASFGLAALIGGLSGVLIAPITTLYYDSGFIISLKGFVGAVVGGLVSYPLGALGALAVGLVEAYSTFWASAYKEVIVFTLILPFLLWRSLSARHSEEDA
ncbi:amino acid/amide ABC transporter membrane protein 1 (HAAT family) [Sphaerotilus hippei]|uniref:Amino acid/amide ABC transporter membrane protein 1 (HAAT family) n=1 Tax=Sphaerotilus hippei TaxID=744406 RepID=A0A318H5X5_9BURK|nr:branched-chain amino acid ABC transporter permease [Sphaerotilus hippei]PXW99374.1 amino acid/amide ABC transporter membrane protein 1 (HAAT family) [Sphaerotilus hippei]